MDLARNLRCQMFALVQQDGGRHEYERDGFPAPGLFTCGEQDRKGSVSSKEAVAGRGTAMAPCKSSRSAPARPDEVPASTIRPWRRTRLCSKPTESGKERFEDSHDAIRQAAAVHVFDPQ